MRRSAFPSSQNSLPTSPVLSLYEHPPSMYALLSRHVPGSAQFPVVEWHHQRIHVWPGIGREEGVTDEPLPRLNNTPKLRASPMSSEYLFAIITSPLHLSVSVSNITGRQSSL